MPTLILPRQLASLAGGLSRLSVKADTLAAALAAASAEHPRLGAVLLDPQGRVSPFVGVFVDGAQLGEEEMASARLSPGSSVQLVAAVAGG